MRSAKTLRCRPSDETSNGLRSAETGRFILGAILRMWVPTA